MLIQILQTLCYSILWNITNQKLTKSIIEKYLPVHHLKAKLTSDVQISLIMTARARQLCWPPAIMFYCCRFFLSFFRRLISEFPWPIVTKLSHMFDGDPDLWNLVRNLGPLPSEIWRDFGQFRDFIAIISGTQQEIVNQKTAYANYGQSHTGKLNLVYFGPQTAKNRIGVVAMVQRTGVNKSVAFARWRNGRPLGWTVPHILVILANIG